MDTEINTNCNSIFVLYSRGYLYHCSYCDKLFTVKGEFVLHQKMHTVDKQYKCSLCVTWEHTLERSHINAVIVKVYTLKGNLLRHEKTHTGEKTYCCSHCDKAFPAKRELVIHQKMHTGDNQYQCNHCGKDFIQKINLLLHQRTHLPSLEF